VLPARKRIKFGHLHRTSFGDGDRCLAQRFERSGCSKKSFCAPASFEGGGRSGGDEIGKSNYFSWSYSRSSTLATCPRKYFLEYFPKGEPGLDVAAWKLKELVSLPMWAGTVVDFILSTALDRMRRGHEIRELHRFGRRHYRRGIERSLEIVTLMKERARTKAERDADPFKPLVHHFYRFDVGTDHVQEMEERVATCLKNFEASSTFERMREIGPAHWGLIAKVDEAVAPSFELNGCRVYAAFDLWLEDKDKGGDRDGKGDGDRRDFYLLDWKSGSDSDFGLRQAERQLAVYALWAAYEKKIPIERIHTQAVWMQNLSDWKPRQVVKKDLRKVRDGIIREIEAELNLVEVRQFASRTEYHAKMEAFPAKPKHALCLHCKYREICPEGQATCAHVPLVEQVSISV
jgi:hypothetical protein